MGDNRNYARHLALREGAAMVLRLAGVEGVQPAPRATGRRLSDAFATSEYKPRLGDILGLPSGWLLDVTTAEQSRWGSHLDSAELAARLSGAERGALVVQRRGQPVSRSFVVMSLDTFAEILTEQHGDAR